MSTHERQPELSAIGRDDLCHSAVAIAYPNMALVKYWGKRDEAFVLPVAGSISMTLDIFPTTTRVTLVKDARSDVVRLNGQPADRVTQRRATALLNLVRRTTNRAERAMVETTNAVPTGAGLASSASGFAALAAAAAATYDLRQDGRSLSRLARRGSGSACRSIFGGLVAWHAGVGLGRVGDDGSYAEPIDADLLDPAIVIAIVDGELKKMPSREAMRHTMKTSPLYRAWAQSVEEDLREMNEAIARNDLSKVGEVAERNSSGMHATMLAARPALRYYSPDTVTVLDRVVALRASGIVAYATIDAGPNVAVLCARADEHRVAAELGQLDSVIATHIAHLGPGVTVFPGSEP